MSRDLRHGGDPVSSPSEAQEHPGLARRRTLGPRARRVALVGGAAVAAALVVPEVASALSPPSNDAGDAIGYATQGAGTVGGDLVALSTEVNNFWLIFGAALVFLMQLGFLGLEVGFSRGKNVGNGIAKIFVNLSVAAVCWWAVGFAFAFGGADKFLGTDGFFFQNATAAGDYNGSTSMAFAFFQFTFAAVSLAIVWGTTLERVKFIVYPIFALIFSVAIYPVIAHWGFGGGLFSTFGQGGQDFAGSTVVHLTGATAALAACIVLGPRLGKYTADKKPRAIPGHSMPIFGIGVIVLWVGWFGFNGASTLGTDGSTFAHVIAVTNLAAGSGALVAMITTYAIGRTFDVGMIGNGAIAALVAITAPSGFVEMWAAPIIGGVGGLIVVFGVLAVDRIGLDDPVGAISAHGLAGIWGTLACGLFASPRLAESVGVGEAGLFYSGSFEQLGVQALVVVIAFAYVFIVSFAAFKAMDMTFGIRVSREDELAGLDISEHGMYGYPEQFIPEAEMVGYAAADPSRVTLANPALVSTKES